MRWKGVGIVVGLLLVIAVVGGYLFASGKVPHLIPIFESKKTTPSGNSTDTTENKSPQTRIVVNRTTVYVNENLTFHAGESSDEDGWISKYKWEMGYKGTTTVVAEGATATNLTYTFPSKGNYTLILTVTDNLGASDNESVEIVVNQKDQEIEPTQGLLLTFNGLLENFASASATVPIEEGARRCNITTSLTTIRQGNVEWNVSDPKGEVLDEGNASLRLAGSEEVQCILEADQLRSPGHYVVYVRCTAGSTYYTIRAVVSY